MQRIKRVDRSYFRNYFILQRLLICSVLVVSCSGLAAVDPNEPTLFVSESHVGFVGYLDGSNPENKTIVIRNMGGGTMNWSITDVNDLPIWPEWLTIAPTSGSLQQNQSTTVSLSADITGLAAGYYPYNLKVSAPGAAYSPGYLGTSVRVDGPKLSVSETSIAFSVYDAGGNPWVQALTISNIGGGTLNWVIASVGGSTFSPPAWLTVSPVSGSLSLNDMDDIVTLSANTAGLPEGVYTYQFQVSAPNTANSPQIITVILNTLHVLFVDDDADPALPMDGSAEHPFNTIQAGIEETINGDDPNDLDTVIVRPGTYYENLNFHGKNLVLTSSDPLNPEIVESTIINANGHGYVVEFGGTELAGTALQGFTIINRSQSSASGCGIRGNGTHAAIRNCVIKGTQWGLTDCDGSIVNCRIIGNGEYGMSDCDGPIVNCTIAHNVAGGWPPVGVVLDCDGPIVNCIVWGNYALVDSMYGSAFPSFSLIQDRTGGIGNISGDPLFADAANDDFHLKSQYGRWDQAAKQWVYDTVTSPCIDAGDPESAWQAELWPHGGRINMGAYGGTPEASLSANTAGNVADLDHDNVVGLSDLTWFVDGWLYAAYLLDTDMDRNGIVDMADMAIFAGQWLWTDD